MSPRARHDAAVRCALALVAALALPLVHAGQHADEAARAERRHRLLHRAHAHGGGGLHVHGQPPSAPWAGQPAPHHAHGADAPEHFRMALRPAPAPPLLQRHAQPGAGVAAPPRALHEVPRYLTPKWAQGPPQA